MKREKGGREESRINKKRCWKGTRKEDKGKQEKRRKEREKGRRKKADFLPRRNHHGAGPQKTPRPGCSSLLLPLTASPPLPSPARLRWFPCGQIIFKNADAVPPPGPHTVATGASAKPRDPTQLWEGKEG